MFLKWRAIGKTTFYFVVDKISESKNGYLIAEGKAIPFPDQHSPIPHDTITNVSFLMPMVLEKRLKHVLKKHPEKVILIKYLGPRLSKSETPRLYRSFKVNSTVFLNLDSVLGLHKSSRKVRMPNIRQMVPR